MNAKNIRFEAERIRVKAASEGNAELARLAELVAMLAKKLEEKGD